MTCIEEEGPEWWVDGGSLGQLNENLGNSYFWGSAISKEWWLALGTDSTRIFKRNTVFDPWVGTQSASSLSTQHLGEGLVK